MSCTTTEITVDGTCSATLVDRTCTNSVFTVRVQFKNPDGSAVLLDAMPDFTVVSGRTEEVRFGPQSMTLNSGLYNIALNLNDWNPGLYRFSATGLVSGTPVRLEGAFNVFEPTRQQQLIYIVKSRLNDLNVELYKLDLPLPKWSEDQILQELEMALSDLSSKPPMPGLQLTYDNAPYHFLVQYAAAQCLKSAATLENWDTYQMSDGSASLTLNRASFLEAQGQAALNRYDEQALAWKRSLRPGVRGLGTALFPLQIRRAIGFLPNMKQVFGP